MKRKICFLVLLVSFFSINIISISAQKIPKKTVTFSRIDLQKINKITANDDESILSLKKRNNEITKVLKRSDYSKAKLKVAANRQISLSSVISKTTVDTNKFASNMNRSKSYLLGNPVVTEVVVETDQEYIVSKSVKVVVKNPKSLQRKSPQFASYMSKKSKSRKSYAKLSAKDKRLIDDYLRSYLPKMSANHPLKKYADQGKDQLLNAINDGYGEFEITDTFSISKNVLPIINGKLLQPQYNSNFLESATKAALRKSALDNSRLASRVSSGTIQMQPRIVGLVTAPEPGENQSGETNMEKKLLLGFTQGKSWSWSRRWGFSVGYFKIRMGAGYGYGFRVPVNFEMHSEPRRIEVTDTRDKRKNISVTFKADAINAPASFYRGVGLPNDKIFDGNEIVLEARFYYQVKLRAFRKNWINKHKRWEFNKSRDWDPPLGNDTEDFVFPIPPSVTGTDFNAGALRGYLQFGALFELRGTLTGDAAIMNGSNVIRSRRVTINQNGTRLSATLPAASRPTNGNSVTKAYKFRLSDMNYNLAATLMPAIRASISLNTSVYDCSYTTDWLKFDMFSIEIGDVDFGIHRGTPGRISKVVCSKTFNWLDPASITSTHANFEGTVSLQGNDLNGGFIKSNGVSFVLAERRDDRRNAQFEITQLGIENGKKMVAIKRKGSYYLQAIVSRPHELNASAPRISNDNQKFIVYRYNGGIVLKSKAQNKFVYASPDSDGKLFANMSDIDRATIFMVHNID